MAAKNAVTVKKGATTKVKKGAELECTECGMVLTVDTQGSCDFVDCVICCGKPMKLKE